MATAKKKEEAASPIPQSENSRCFIVTQIGADDSDIRRSADGLIDAVIAPVLQEFDLTLHVSHREFDPGSINRRIIRHLLEDKLVIANLTNLNPNAMYELAVRHAIRKPVVTMAEKGTALPFDVRDSFAVFYTDAFYSVLTLKEQLKLAIEAAFSEPSPNNPIYDGVADLIIRSIDPGSRDNYYAERLDRIEEWMAANSRDKDGVIDKRPNYVIVAKGDMIQSRFDELMETLRGSLFFPGNRVKKLGGWRLPLTDPIRRERSLAFDSLRRDLTACGTNWELVIATDEPSEAIQGPALTS